MSTKSPDVAAQVSNINAVPKEEVAGFAQKGRDEIEAVSRALRNLINGTKSVDFMLAPPEAQRGYMDKVAAAISDISQMVTGRVNGLSVKEHFTTEKAQEAVTAPLAKLMLTVDDLNFPTVESEMPQPVKPGAAKKYTRSKFYNLRISGLLAKNPDLKSLFLGDVIQLKPTDFPELGEKWLMHLIEALRKEGLQLGTTLTPELLRKFENSKRQKYQKETAKKLEEINVDIDILMIPISFLELPVRAENALASKGIKFIGDFIGKSYNSLLRIPGCGVSTATAMKEAVENIGLRLETFLDPKLKEDFEVAKTQV